LKYVTKYIISFISRLLEFLKYMIVPGSHKVEELTDGLKLFTLQGTAITITRNSTGIVEICYY